MSKSRIMFEMSVKDIRDGLQEMKTVILPIGIAEQHGNHLPISVDIYNAVEIAHRASERTGCFVAPPLNYCFSGGMLPGTININPQLFSLVLIDICRSLMLQGFKNIIIFLGHGGSENTKAAKDGAENFLRLSPDIEGITVSVIGFWELSATYMKSVEDCDYHAGFYETSLMLYWHPELVKMDQAELDDDDLVKMMKADPDSYLLRHKDVDHEYVTPKLTQHPRIRVGVMGNYEGANAEIGQKIAEECTDSLASFIDKLESR